MGYKVTSLNLIPREANVFNSLYDYKVTSLNLIPDGFIGFAIPGGKYQVFIPTGKFLGSFGEARQQIWKSDINRA